MEIFNVITNSKKTTAITVQYTVSLDRKDNSFSRFSVSTIEFHQKAIFYRSNNSEIADLNTAQQQIKLMKIAGTNGIHLDTS